MKTVSKLTSVTLASATATLLFAGCGEKSETTKAATPDSATKVATVKCSGINSCKGDVACATATHACAGKNDCKGQGWVKATKADCDSKGGKVVLG